MTKQLMTISEIVQALANKETVIEFDDDGNASNISIPLNDLNPSYLYIDIKQYKYMLADVAKDEPINYVPFTTVQEVLKHKGRKIISSGGMELEIKNAMYGMGNTLLINVGAASYSAQAIFTHWRFKDDGSHIGKRAM